MNPSLLKTFKYKKASFPPTDLQEYHSETSFTFTEIELKRSKKILYSGEIITESIPKTLISLCGSSLINVKLFRFIIIVFLQFESCSFCIFFNSQTLSEPTSGLHKLASQETDCHGNRGAPSPHRKGSGVLGLKAFVWLRGGRTCVNVCRRDRQQLWGSFVI